MMVHWLIDDRLTETTETEYPEYPSMKEAISLAGHSVTVMAYKPFANCFDYEDIEYDPEDGPIVVHGTIEFVKQVKRFRPNWCPGVYLNEHNLKFSTCATYFGKYMLNNDYQLMTYGEVIRKQPFGENFFIRPDVVTKPFAGRVVHTDTIEDDFRNMWRYQNIDMEEMCVVAPLKKRLLGEYRHFVVNRKIVTESQYERNGKFLVRREVQPECAELAREIASSKAWQPDYCYTLDTVWDGEKASVMEFNSFSCSGIYACDTVAIVRAVSEMAVKEFYGDLDDC